jgi:hypothetical protein
MEYSRDVRPPFGEQDLRALPPECEAVQFTSLPSDADLERLAGVIADRPDVLLRAYGSYDGSIRDLEFLRFFSDRRRIAVDVFELEDMNGLNHLSEDLETLALGWTRRRFSLAPLRGLRALRALHLEGHTKDIEALSALTTLDDLTLRSIKLPDLSVLLPLERLRSLAIKLGGTTDLRLLPRIGRLEFLELWLVRGLDDIDAVGGLETLRFLFLQALKRVERLPAMSDLGALTRVHLETMKGLDDLSPLRQAPALTDLVAVDMPQLREPHLEPLVGHPTLARVRIGTGSVKRDRQLRELFGLPDTGHAHFLEDLEG